MSQAISITAVSSNRKLSGINFVTSVGDFLTLLASLKLIHLLTGSPLYAGYVIAVRSLGVGLGSMAFPRLISGRKLEEVLAFSELISGAFSVLVLGSIFAGLPAWSFLVLFGLQSVSKQQFSLGRDTYSKLLGTTESHRSLTAQIVGGTYGAALIGSVLAYGVLQFAHPWVLFSIDAMTFLVSAALCFRMESKEVASRSLSFLRPIGYLKANKALLWVFLIRGVVVWVPIATFNFLLYTLTEKQFQLDISANAWTYVATAAGSVLSSIVLGPRLRLFAKHREAFLAAFGSFLIGLTRLGLLHVPSFALLNLVIFIAGIFNGSNMIASQTLIRSLASEDEFPEVSALEQILSRLSDFLVATFFAFLVGKGLISYRTGMMISACGFWFVAASYLLILVRPSTKSI